MMQEIQSREYERKLQLLPGSEAREAALVNSVEELKAQMELANKRSRLVYNRNIMIIITTVIIVGSIFLSTLKVSKLLKYLGAALSISALIESANSNNLVNEVPSVDNFSAMDRAYSFLTKVNDYYNTSDFLKLVVKVTLDTMIALELIKPVEMKVKQSLLKNNKSKVRADIKEAILDYGGK